MSGALLRGFLLSLALILPLGPQNVFVLGQGALQPRLRLVLPVILTAALCDTLLIGLAVGGASLAISRLPFLQRGLEGLAVAFLLYIAWVTWRAPAAQDPEEAAAAWGTARKVRYSLSVSLLNPHAILDTLVVIGGAAAVYPAAPERWAFGVGAALVSWLWFFALASLGGVLRRLGGRQAVGRVLARVSAVLLTGLALVFAWQLLSGR